MYEYKIVKETTSRKIVSAMACNKCGLKVDMPLGWDPKCNDLHPISAEGGYGSEYPKDMETISFILCSTCLLGLTSTFKIPHDSTSSDINRLGENMTNTQWLDIREETKCYRDILGQYNIHYPDVAGGELNLDWRPGNDGLLQIRAKELPWFNPGDRSYVAYQVGPELGEIANVELPVVWVKR